MKKILTKTVTALVFGLSISGITFAQTSQQSSSDMQELHRQRMIVFHYTLNECHARHLAISFAATLKSARKSPADTFKQVKQATQGYKNPSTNQPVLSDQKLKEIVNRVYFGDLKWVDYDNFDSQPNYCFDLANDASQAYFHAEDAKRQGWKPLK